MEWVKVAKSLLSAADVQAISVKGKRLVLVKQAGEFHAFTSKCPHAGADLATAWCEKGYLVCPIHRHAYNLKNGRGAIGQGDYLTKYLVKNQEDHLLIGLPKPWFKFW